MNLDNSVVIAVGGGVCLKEEGHRGGKWWWKNKIRKRKKIQENELERYYGNQGSEEQNKYKEKIIVFYMLREKQTKSDIGKIIINVYNLYQENYETC